MLSRPLPFHDEIAASVHAPVESVFTYFDEPKTLATHMSKSSMMMPGLHMTIDADADGGRSVGSRIRMKGRMMGISLSLEEVVTQRHAPYQKMWETVGTPDLKVMAQYRMGFDLMPMGDLTNVRVYIDYCLPEIGPRSWLGRMFGGMYAHWCTKRMIDDAVKHFSSGGK